MAAEIAIRIEGDLQKVNLGPGDFLVLRLSQQPSAEIYARIRAYFEQALQGVADRKVPIIVLGPDMDLQVMHDAFDSPNPEG